MKNFLFKRCALLLLITNLFSIPHEAPLKCNTAMTFADSEATFCSDSRGSAQISSRVYELFFGNKADKRSAEYLIPGGDVFGIKLSESYVSVTGSLDGSAFKTGDKILTLAGVTITGAKDVTRVLESYTGGSISAEILRGGEKMSITVIPKRYDNSYKLGVTLRDTASGIGTVSYIDPETKAFGGLGHGVCDPLTSTPVSIKSGEATGVILGGVTRGEIGKPGELSGILNKRHLGEVAINSECGVFGVLDSFDTQGREALPVGKKSELHRGEAEKLDRIESLLVKKGAEYNLDENDRFSDFKQAAAFTGQTPEQVLYGYMLKHLMSVTAMVQSEKTFTKELWNEKITDICNYLILLQGLLRDTGRMSIDKE